MFSFTTIKSIHPYRPSIRSHLRFFSLLPLSVISACDLSRKISARRFFRRSAFPRFISAARFASCVQITGASFFLFLFPINYIILSFRVIACEVLSADKTAEEQTKMPCISAFLHNKSSLPVLALLLLIPLLGIIAVILLLFGQEPDSAVKLWTETADWTMSQKIAPENLPRDGHYLCTVAAEGHKKLVKPLRTGKRHGHEITVNRQLCIANAFEQLLSERTPHLHRAIRNFYDKTGYPIAKHIKTPLAADIVYIIMKPLEWLFLLVLYLFDTKPENRIATQYPHSAPPKI